MQIWLIFLSGLIIGSVTGIFVMCLCAVSSVESEKEERTGVHSEIVRK